MKTNPKNPENSPRSFSHRDDSTFSAIYVLVPFFKNWTYLFYLSLVGLVVLVYRRFFSNRAKLREQLLHETREAERIKELDTLKTRLYTNITHEFRTPLTIIIGMAQQALEKPNVHFRNSQEMIIRNSEYLLRLVNEMLDLSKLENNKMTLQLVQGDIVVFLKFILESFNGFAKSKNLHLHFLSDVDVLFLDYDPEKMRQVMTNLLSNAIKFTPEGEHVYFSVSQMGADSLIIKVKDTGIGITAEQIEHIFDRFYQVDQGSMHLVEGTGIGLSLTKELVKLMQGEINVCSPPPGANKGSEFIVKLPIVRSSNLTSSNNHLFLSPEFQVPGVLEAPIPNDHSSFSESKKAHILIVEDNQDVVTYLSSFLSEYRIEVAENGLIGFGLAIKNIPDLIISDVMMPIMDGFELCKRLKTEELSSHIPIILLTARADMESKLEGLEHRADVYLEKPFRKEELLVHIDNLLELRKKMHRHYQQLMGLPELEGSIIDSTVPDSKEHDFVKKVREIIEMHLTDFNFNVDQLSRKVYLSQSQLKRKLNALAGISPNHFIRFIRLSKAKTLLLNPERSIISIAFDCGFSDPGYFARVFKQNFGLRPQEWRAKNQ